MSNRTCGDCKLCCYLVPTPEIDLPANTHCRHECGKGCAIYERRPMSCQMWSCQWLLGEDVGPRPDRCGYVVDMMPDFVTGVDEATGKQTRFPIHQIWVDPARPDSHRHPALRRWLAEQERQNGLLATVRYGNDGGMLLVPPARSEDGQWFERTTNMRQGPANSAAEVIRELERQGIGMEIVVADDNTTITVRSGGGDGQAETHSDPSAGKA